MFAVLLLSVLRYETYRITRGLGVIFVDDFLEENVHFHQVVVRVIAVGLVEIWTQFRFQTSYNCRLQ